jgi:hypothetical protein
MKIDIGKIKEVKLEESGQLDDTKSEKTKKKKKNKKTDINN